MREAKLIVVDDTILRLDDFTPFVVDETIETADTNRGAVVREWTDPVVLRLYRNRAIAADRPTQTNGKVTGLLGPGRSYNGRPSASIVVCRIALPSGVKSNGLSRASAPFTSNTAINAATFDNTRTSQPSF